MNNFFGYSVTTSNFQINLHDISLILCSSSLLVHLAALITWVHLIKNLHLLRADISDGFILRHLVESILNHSLTTVKSLSSESLRLGADIRYGWKHAQAFLAALCSPPGSPPNRHFFHKPLPQPCHIGRKCGD